MQRLICATALLLMGEVHAQAILKPPFGLNWGDSPEKLIGWAKKHSLNITINLPGNQDRLSLLRISSSKGFLPGHQASAVEGRFIGGKLYELTVDYADPRSDAAQMKNRFDILKTQLAKEHGVMRGNQQQRTVNDQFVTRTVSYHREPVKGLFLLLAYTEVEDLLRHSKKSRFSLVYRNDNFRKELEQLQVTP